jgi:hypothetical protein
MKKVTHLQRAGQKARKTKDVVKENKEVAELRAKAERFSAATKRSIITVDGKRWHLALVPDLDGMVGMICPSDPGIIMLEDPQDDAMVNLLVRMLVDSLKNRQTPVAA